MEKTLCYGISRIGFARKIVYRLTKEEDAYRLCVRIRRFGRITDEESLTLKSATDARRLFRIVVRGKVTPCTLHPIAQDLGIAVLT